MPTSTDSMLEPRFMGVPTFMRTPFQPDPTGLDIAMLGVAYDGGVTNRPGTRHGPRDLRDKSSMMRTIHHVTRLNPYAICSIADIGDVPLTGMYDPPTVVAEIEAFVARVKSAGALPLTAGGDHSITYPILKALAKDGPVGLIHVDAHTDTWDSFQGSQLAHGAPFRRAHDDGLIDAARTIQIGIRGAQNSPEGWDYSKNSGMRVMFMEEVSRIGIDAVIAEARALVGDGPVYLSFDIDSLDPVYAPGTGTPEVGGLTVIEAQALLRGLRNLNYIGADLVEVAPPFDQTGNTALVGATLMYEILCLMAESINERR
ncbi:MAG: agmatinase [Pseudomonadota bacterium]